MSINSITSKFDSSSNVQFGIGNNNSSTIASVLTENEQNLQAGHSPSRAAQRQALSQRLANTIERNRLRQSTPAVSGNANVATNKADVNPELRTAAFAAIEELKHSGASALEGKLTRQYDALERHSLLRQAISQSTGEDKKALEGMLTRLEEKHGPEIAKALNKMGAMEAGLSKLGGGALEKFADFYGTKPGVKNQTPPNALEMVHFLKRSVGTENVANVLSTTPTGIADDLRSRSNGVRGWYSLRVVNEMNRSRSFLKHGKSLRSNLSEKAGVIPKSDEVDSTIALLEVTERGSNATQFAEKFVKSDDLGSEETKNKVFKELAKTTRELPWSADKYNLRMDLLSDLDGKDNNSDPYLQQPKQHGAYSADKLREMYLANQYLSNKNSHLATLTSIPAAT